ncbi:MAG: hypothetical protein IT440_09945 [Phycisphaeraceae bacterium]|nr:hypothetical protein [Phycisphaeraceae bacterium]
MSTQTTPSNGDASARTITVVNIMAVSYTGSTWLNLMLGAHPDHFSCGEIDSLRKQRQPTCTLHGPECPVWSRIKVGSDENLFMQIARVTGKRVLIVNNSRHFRADLRHPRIRRCNVLILRDGRGFVASAMNKRPGQSIRQYTQVWRRQTRNRYFRMLLDRECRRHVLHYEDLRDDPEKHLRELCTSFDLSFHPNMLRFSNAQPHFIGGSGGPIYVLARTHGLSTLYYVKDGETEPTPGSIDQTTSSVYARYKDNHGEVIHEELWLKMLTDEHLHQFRRAGGWLNWLLGYPPTMERDTRPRSRRSLRGKAVNFSEH